MRESPLHFRCFDANGDPIRSATGSGDLSLPEYLDWRDISAKTLYLEHMGGFPPETCFMLIESQGQTKLLFGLDNKFEPQTYQQRKEIQDGVHSWLQQECRKRGISLDGTPRNQ